MGDVGQHDTVDASLCGALGKALEPIGEEHIGIGHEDQRDPEAPRAKSRHHIDDLVGGDMVFEGANVGPPDRRPLGRGIRERYAQLNEVRPGPLHSPHDLFGKTNGWIPTGDERDEGLLSTTVGGGEG